jgi:hypothetical protein
MILIDIGVESVRPWPLLPLSVVAIRAGRGGCRITCRIAHRLTRITTRFAFCIRARSRTILLEGALVVVISVLGSIAHAALR